MDLTVVLPAINEADNLARLLPKIHETASALGSYEILVVDGGSTDGTAARAASLGASVHRQTEPGYGGALKEAFRRARGEYVVTMDADYSHNPEFIRDLWAARHRGAAVIASRYVAGGASEVSGFRSVLSRILNTAFRRVLSIPLRDMSSGFRLYRRSALLEAEITSRHFDALEEVLIKIVGLGYPVAEVPFVYRARHKGVSKARILRFGLDLARTLHRLWTLRNGADWCDYDHRAYDSPIFLQRYWQRRRHRIVLGWHRPGRTLDIGCGSSRILEDLGGAVGLDVSMPKLRFMSGRGCRAARGSVFALPFRDGAFDEVVFSQVIEHIPRRPETMAEIRRVLRPGGRLIIGTPDYGRMFWVLLEWFYGKLRPEAYAHEHISHYTLGSMRRLLAENGFEHVRSRYVGGGELIQLALKPR
jgi:dolichol-phosphate mannosyltransferase